MKKSHLLIMLLLIWSALLLSIDDDTMKKFEKAHIHKAKEVDIIRFEPMKPDIERYQKKTDTNISTGFYQLYKNNLRTTNKVLLNKWLKESK